MTFEISAWVLAGFLTFYGIFFLYLSKKETEKPLAGLLNMKTVYLLFALFYLAIAHMSIFTSFAYSVDVSTQAPCENIISNSTAINTSFTQYTFADSCDGRAPPESQSRLLLWWSYLLFIEVFGIVAGIVLLSWRAIQKW